MEMTVAMGFLFCTVGAKEVLHVTERFACLFFLYCFDFMSVKCLFKLVVHLVLLHIKRVIE